MNKVLISVHKEDAIWMMTTGRDLFIKEHPEFLGHNIIRAFMFKKMCEYYGN